MVKILMLLLLPMVILGCSNSSGISTPDITEKAEAIEAQDNHWDWGMWEFRFNDDHTQVEAVTQRAGQYHYCVTKLLEEYPCPNCLSIGQPAVQPDGTVKLKVTMKHPFPYSPQYTGFDVRGMVYFQYTEYHIASNSPYCSIIWKLPPQYGGIKPSFLGNSMPLSFSRSSDGGGEVLNPDGYSSYLIPGVTYSEDWSIFSYSPPKHSNEPTPELTTINPYKLFASDSERRMFLVTDKITREYHFALPPGPFNFGYAVDASWWPPAKTPVTNPIVDFPREANADDPWLVEFEQLLPLKEENVDKVIFKTTVHHRGLNKIWGAEIWSWDLTLSGEHNPKKSIIAPCQDWEFIDDYTTVLYGKLNALWWSLYGKDGMAVPGHHFGVLLITQTAMALNVELTTTFRPCFVDIYVEG